MATDRQEREARLKAALRANLKKRKDQARAAEPEAGDPPAGRRLPPAEG